MVSLSDYPEFSIHVPVYAVIILCIPMLMCVPGFIYIYIYIYMYICVCRYVYVCLSICIFMYICVYVCTSKLVVWLSRTAIPIYSMVNPLCLQVRDLTVYPGFIHLLCCFRHLYTTTRQLAHVNVSDHGSNPCPESCLSSSPSTPPPFPEEFHLS